ncbi:MAG: DUF4105 domain-containing protein [Gemmatimonadota bacterium]
MLASLISSALAATLLLTVGVEGGSAHLQAATTPAGRDKALQDLPHGWDNLPGSHLTVYLVTMGPGDQVWERFGHNAIWIHDAQAGTDVAYNWGLFDFDQEDFIPRFLEGEMLYWMGGFDALRMVELYRQENRTVELQELNLPPARRLALQDFVRWNARPDHRFYLYHYFLDNCSTRARDALDLGLEGVLERRFSNQPAGESWRSVVRRVLEGNIPEYLALDIILSSPADEAISVWEEMFIPMVLRDRIREVQVEGPTGDPIPLVASQQILFTADRSDPTGRSRIFIPLLAGISLLLGGSAALSRGRVPLLLVGGGWSLVSGLLGVVMLFLWLGSGHTFGYGNLNLLQMSPLGVLLLVLLPVSLFRKGRGRTGHRGALRLAAGVLGLSILGVLLLPFTSQSGGLVALLAFPLHLGIWWGLQRRTVV